MKAIIISLIIICLGAVGFAITGFGHFQAQAKNAVAAQARRAPSAPAGGPHSSAQPIPATPAPGGFAAAAPAPGGFAVVELFTSEGCSSCPPADELVAKIQRENNDHPVYVLAFHVDYWNHLGWKDVFSDAAWSKRQSQYAGWLHLSSIYTPQVVVNGGTEFVGSEEGKLREAIKDNLKKAPSAQLTLKDVKINQGSVDLKYESSGAAGNTSLLLAIVQKTGTTQVKRGENGGLTLSHVQIVRGLQTIALTGGASQGTAGTARLDLPSGLGAEDVEIIAFLQNSASGEILAATKAQI